MKAHLAPCFLSPREHMTITRMTMADVQEVLRIESLSFPSSWPRNAFSAELNDNKLAYYFVGRIGSELIAYGGVWVMLEDSHVTTIAVHPDWRGRRYGEEIFARMLSETVTQEAAWMTLEVRKSNVAAQYLYQKYGFTVIAQRPAYYNDNHETALVMWAGNLRSELYRKHLRIRQNALRAEIESMRP
jgi:[ribosomal protein S18]-alanine N-acetyltransferase